MLPFPYEAQGEAVLEHLWTATKLVQAASLEEANTVL